MKTHATQIFMHNPKALRLELRLDDEQLDLWWSPKAGKSFDCRDRNFANRDNPLTVFERINLPGCSLENFVRCEYDPYHSVVVFKEQTLHLVLLTDQPVLLLWAEREQRVDFKTGRYDQALAAEKKEFSIRHVEPAYAFEFTAQMGAGKGAFRHGDIHAEWYSIYAQAVLAPGQMLAIGAGLKGEGIAKTAASAVRLPASAHLKAIEKMLAPAEATGRIVAPQHPELEKTHRNVVRGLHSIIDDSGAMRASIKNIYYLIWVRDGGFGFPYQAAAGWPHRLEEFCKLLLANPTTVRGKGIPPGKMFAQLINKDYGKYEEDGIFYVIWCLFTLWTQTGWKTLASGKNLALVEGAMRWVEEYIYDKMRGLFGSYFADETPAGDCRDDQWDYAIGQPACYEPPKFEGVTILRFYDTYMNMLMHSAYSMLAALTGGKKADGYTAKAAALWENLKPFFDIRKDGLPTYGELLLKDGRRVFCPHWGASHSVYVWGLSLPCFAPLDDWDTIRQRLFEEIAAKPQMHFVNGICSSISSVDPWFYPENKLLEMILNIAAQAEKPGKYLPMSGAMPEKYDAPEGNIYHDIRPQGFAMQSWLAAAASLGLRRLPYGLALRPTRCFTEIQNYAWKERILRFVWNGAGKNPLLVINGKACPGTLQIPESRLRSGKNTVELRAGTASLLLLRSTIELNDVVLGRDGMTICGEAFGLSELWFSALPASVAFNGADIPFTVQQTQNGTAVLRFTLHGPFALTVR